VAELELLALDRLLVDECPVGAVQVVDDVAALLLRDLGVLARDPRVVDDDMVERGAADQARRLEREPLPEEVAVQREEAGHGGIVSYLAWKRPRDRVLAEVAAAPIPYT